MTTDITPSQLRGQVSEAVHAAGQVPDPFAIDPEAEQALVPRYKLLGFSDLAELPEPEWLVNGILPAESLAFLYGVSGVGKSFVALDMALSVASGIPWHGDASTRPGKVVYIAGEGVRGLYRRVAAWLHHHPEVDVDTVKRNLFVLPQAVQLLRPDSRTQLLATLQDQQYLRLVVVDTLARATVGADENSARDMGSAVDVLDRVRTETGATALVIHHTGKSGDVERGSGALRGAADSMLLVKPAQQNIALICDKQKDAPPFAQLHFRLRPELESAVLELANGVTHWGSPSPSSFGVRTQDSPFDRRDGAWF